MTESEFNPQEFLKRHVTVSNHLNERQIDYTLKELFDLVKIAHEVFLNEPMLARLAPPCTIVGDIHGQYADLMRIINRGNDRKDTDTLAYSKGKYMFLGDYIDRGRRSVECICLVFALKICYPKNYMLLRGNHECRAINHAYGFKDELCDRFTEPEGLEIWEAFNDAFSVMPVAGLIGSKILCMHGGISEHLDTLESINEIKRPLYDASTNPLALDLLWADPMDSRCFQSVEHGIVYKANQLRGLSVVFSENAVIDTCKRLDLKLIVRAHQLVDSGFKFFADRRLCTVFSAPRYTNETENKGSIMIVNKNGHISLSILSARRSEVRHEKEDDTKYIAEQPRKKKDRGGSAGKGSKKSPKE